MQTWHPKNERETIAIGKKIALLLQGGDIVLLFGELGAGKTTLCKGIAQSLGITRTITSPTFTLIQLYTLKKSVRKISELAHVDTYRMKSADELRAIGLQDYLGAPHTLSLIEWPEKILPLIHQFPCWIVEIKGDSRGREINFHFLSADQFENLPLFSPVEDNPSNP